jgi:hypothetical protein
MKDVMDGILQNDNQKKPTPSAQKRRAIDDGRGNKSKKDGLPQELGPWKDWLTLLVGLHG